MAEVRQERVRQLARGGGAHVQERGGIAHAQKEEEEEGERGKRPRVEILLILEWSYFLVLF